MQLKQIRYSISIGAIAIIGIIIIQTQWIFTTWEMNKNELNNNIWLVLKQTSQTMAEYHDCASSDLDPVQNITNSCYLVQLPCEFSQANLKHILESEFTKQNLSINYHLSIYNCRTNHTEYLGSVHNNWNDKLMTETVETCLNEQHPELVNYFIISISGQSTYLFKQIKLWLFFSILVLIILIFFTYTILSFYNQKQLNELQRDFINNMTHELKTPISSIAISGKVLKEYGALLPERANKYLDIISHETKRLNHLVETVLQSAKIDKNHQGMHFERIELHQLIDELLANSHFDKNQDEISIVKAFESNESWILADTLHANNIFINLIDNAIKYNINKPLISIKTQLTSKFIYLHISDNGIGISEKNRKNVFKKFFRISTGDVHDVKGFGLGLFYVKKVCKAHGWSIKLESELNKGSNFIIKFPLSNA